MLTGEQAFPFLNDNEELTERIKNCQFYFPDELAYVELFKKMGEPLPDTQQQKISIDYIDQTSQAESMFGFNDESISHPVKAISEDAKNMIRALIVADGDKRITIPRLKKHQFFAKIRWDHAEKG